ncbi:hypothetical protein, partial [Alicyclobacillus tolerans]
SKLGVVFVQKRIWGLTASMLALTCLTVTGCGNSGASSMFTTTNNNSQITALKSTHSLTTYSSSKANNNKSDRIKSTSTPSMKKSNLQTTIKIYPTPLIGVIEWLIKHTQVPIGAPIKLPQTSLKGFPSAVVQTTSNGWSAKIYMTKQPFHTNSLQILKKSKNGVLQNLVDWELGPSWSIGINNITVTSIPALHTESMNNLLNGFPLDADTESWISWSHRNISLGHGIVGTMYQLQNFSTTLVWNEGDWTFILPNSLAKTEIQVAHAMVKYMNVHLLPPSPGVATVQIGVHGDYANASFLQGNDVIHVSMAGFDETNEAVGVLRMAAKWKLLRL